MDKVEDGLPEVNDQQKVFIHEMLNNLILKFKLSWVHKFYIILPTVEWIIPLPTILIWQKNVFMYTTTISEIMGISNLSNANFEANI